MATQFQKQVKQILEDSSSIHPDKIVLKKDGTVEVKRGYFYRHGMDAKKWASAVADAVAPLTVSVSGQDKWAAWPKDSYFVATVTEIK